jgi:hypothetical protein
VYDGQSFALRYVLTTSHIFGWHTLTYLALDVDAAKVACVTQHGYLVVWRLTGL